MSLTSYRAALPRDQRCGNIEPPPTLARGFVIYFPILLR